MTQPTEHNSELREKLEAELWKLSDYRPGESWGEDDYISRAANAVLALIEEHDRQVRIENDTTLLQLVSGLKSNDPAPNEYDEIRDKTLEAVEYLIEDRITELQSPTQKNSELAALEQGDK